MNEADKNLGLAIKWERMKQKKSQPDFARLVGVSVTWLSNIEARGARPSLALLDRIALELETTAAELMRKAASM